MEERAGEKNQPRGQKKDRPKPQIMYIAPPSKEEKRKRKRKTLIANEPIH